MRDAELRFETLRMRIEDSSRRPTASCVSVIETTLRHPGEAKVMTTDPARATAGSYDIWISDGETVRT